MRTVYARFGLAFAALLLCVLFLAVHGCATDPVRVAESPQARADALFAEFVIHERTVDRLIKDPAVPDSVKMRLKSLDARVAPIAEELDAQSSNITHLKFTKPEDIPAALDALNALLMRAAPLINSYAGQVSKAAEPDPSASVKENPQ